VAADQAWPGWSAIGGHRPYLMTKGMWSKEFVGDFKEGKNLFVAGQEVDPETFEEKHTTGSSSSGTGTERQNPEWAAKITGLPVEQITRVATDYGKAGSQSISWVGGGPVMQVRGAYASMICHCLNGITGACDSVGGTLVNNKEYTVGFPKWDDFWTRLQEGLEDGQDRPPRRKTSPASHRPAGVVRSHNRAADGILNADSLRHQSGDRLHEQLQFLLHQPERWNQALSKIPSGAHHHQRLGVFMVFRHPAALTPTPLRKMGLGKVRCQRLPHVTLQQPVISPCGRPRSMNRDPVSGGGEAGPAWLRQHAELLQDNKGPEPARAGNEKEFALYCVKLTLKPCGIRLSIRAEKVQRLGGIPQGRRLELSPLSVPQALERHEHQDQEVSSSTARP